jgi:hypothetical protein
MSALSAETHRAGCRNGPWHRGAPGGLRFVPDRRAYAPAGENSSSWMLSGSRNTRTEPYGSSAIVDCVSGLSATSARTTPWASMRLPGLEVRPARHHEAGVVKAGDRLGEERRVVGVVAVQHDHQLAAFIGEELADTAGVRNVDLELDAEDVLVPWDADVDVAHGECEVVEPRGRDGHGVLLCVDDVGGDGVVRAHRRPLRVGRQ